MSLKHQWLVKKNWISFSPGIIPALSISILAFTNPGDKIIVQPPVYFPFFEVVQNNGRQLVYNQLINDNAYYRFDLEDLKSKIDSRVKMILLSNPHNPVGKAWTKKELVELATICIENNIIIISDEIHADLVFEPNQHIPMASIFDEIAQYTISTFAPSKTFNVAGLASSVIITPNIALKLTFENKLNDLHLNNGNLFGLTAMEAAYNYGLPWLEELMDYLKGNIALVNDFIKERKLKIELSAC